jgi:hypothetical protein
VAASRIHQGYVMKEVKLDRACSTHKNEITKAYTIFRFNVSMEINWEGQSITLTLQTPHGLL